MKGSKISVNSSLTWLYYTSDFPFRLMTGQGDRAPVAQSVEHRTAMREVVSSTAFVITYTNGFINGRHIVGHIVPGIVVRSHFILCAG